MKDKAKTRYLVEFNSRNIYTISLLNEGMVIGTYDVTFDDESFQNGDELI